MKNVNLTMLWNALFRNVRPVNASGNAVNIGKLLRALDVANVIRSDNGQIVPLPIHELECRKLQASSSRMPPATKMAPEKVFQPVGTEAEFQEGSMEIVEETLSEHYVKTKMVFFFHVYI